MTVKHNELTNWIKKGQPLPLSKKLKDHLKNCEECEKEFEELKQIQSYFQISTPVLSKEESGAIKFRIESECNKEKPVREKPNTLFFWKQWYIPVSVAMVAVIMFFAMLKVFTPSKSTSISSSKTTIIAEHGAKWNYVSKGKMEVVSVSSGKVHFSVKKLLSGESFNVISGDEWVEVRGTKFSIDVSNNKMQKVEVIEGIVEVHVQNTNKLLFAGQSWKRKSSDKIPDNKFAINIKNKTVKPEEKPLIKENPLINIKNPIIKTNIVKKDEKIVKKPEITTNSVLKPKDKIKVKTKIKPKKSKNKLSEKFVFAYSTLQSGNWRKAIVLFRKLLLKRDLGLKRPNILFWLSQAHIQGGQYSVALKRLNQFIKSYPNSWRAKDVKKQIKQLKSRKRKTH
jgi:TolA-binding protein